MSLITIGQVIDESIHHYRKHFGELLRISLWLFAGVPFVILGLALKPADTSVLSGMYVISSILGLAGSILSGVAGIWTLTTLIFAVKAQADSKRADGKSIGRASWKLFGRMLGLSIAIMALAFLALLPIVPGAVLMVMPIMINIPALLSGLGVFLFFVGGVVAAAVLGWMAITLVFAPYAAALENEPVFGAMNRARRLLEGRWWPTMFRVVIPKLIIFVIVFFVQYLIVEMLTLMLASMGDITAETAVLIYEVCKNLSITAISALLAPMLVCADFYVFRSLVNTEKSAT